VKGTAKRRDARAPEAARSTPESTPRATRRVPELALVGAAGGDPVRWPRVRTARERVESGYYEREDVQDLVVNALVNELRRG